MDQAQLEDVQRFLKFQIENSLAEFSSSQYIDLRVSHYDPDRDGVEWTAVLSDEEIAAGLETGHAPRRLESLVGRPDQRTIILVGISGAGKTITLGSFAHRVSVETCNALASGIAPQLVPIWQRAASLPEVTSLSPVGWLGGVLQRGGVYERADTLAASLLASGRLLVLVDSLHEVSHFAPGRLRNLQTLMGLPGVRIVGTSRPGFELLSHGRTSTLLRLHGLSRPEREELLRINRVEREAAEQLRRLALRPRLRRAIEVPQIWQMAVALKQQGIDLDGVTSEVTLYEYFFAALLETQERRQREGEIPLHLRDELIPVLEMLGGSSAFRAGRAVPRGEARELIEGWLAHRARRLRQENPPHWSEQLLEDLPRYYHPVLVPGQHEGVTFAHGSLADFLAARWLLSMSHVVPPGLLPLGQLANVISFHTELQENAHCSDEWLLRVEARQMREGSIELVAPWLQRASRERIEKIAEVVRARVSDALAEPWEGPQLIGALQAKGFAWAQRLLEPLVHQVPDRQRAALMSLFDRKGGHSRLTRERVKRREKQLKRELEKNLRASSRRRRNAASASVKDLIARLKDATDDHQRSRILADIAGNGSEGPGQDIIPYLQTPNPYVQSAAVGALAALGERSAAAAIEALLANPDTYVRSSAARAMGKLRHETALPMLRECLSDENQYVVSAACAAIAVLGNSADGDLIAPLLQHENPVVRGSAIKALGFLRATRWAPEVERRLGASVEGDPMNRGAAAKAVGFLQQSSAVTALIAMVRDDPDPYNKGAAADSLGLLGACEAAGTLRPLVNSLNQFNRASAARALGLVGDRATVPLLLEQLDPEQEQDGIVRGNAATALGVLGDPRAVEPLINSLDPQYEHDGATRGSAATALGVLGDPRAVEPLINSLDPQYEENGAVRGSAATALGMLGDPRAVEPLINSLDPHYEHDGATRGGAATALGVLGDPRAVEPLINSLDPQYEEGENVRGSAATALGVLGDPRAVEPLIKSLDPQYEENGAVRGGAATALVRLGGREAAEHLLRTFGMGSVPSQPGACAEGTTRSDGTHDTMVREFEQSVAKRSALALDVSQEDETTLRSIWVDLLKEFYDQTAAPPVPSFDYELALCLKAVERGYGGAESRGWSEKDYERLLSALLMKDRRNEILTQAEPADRQRTDIIVHSLTDDRRAVLELKFYDPAKLDQHLDQLRRYVESLTAPGHQLTGYLILFVREVAPQWPAGGQSFERNGLHVRLIHVNRPPASKSTLGL